MKPLNRTKIRWFFPLFMALALFRPFNGMAQDDSNFSWLELIPPGCWLDSWSFEETNWASDFGFLPLGFTNIEQVPDWDGNALQVDSTNAASLTYSVVEDAPGYGEWTNISLAVGSIEFFFLSNWQSDDTNYYGSGPGDYGRFIEAGTWATNADWWSLYLNPSGTGIYFSSGTNGVRTNYLNAPISWDGSTWHELVLTFSPSNSFLYLDGQLAASGAGVCYVPSGDALTNGFAIGSDFATGMQQAHGQFDDLYTFNYQLSADDVSNDYAEISPELPGGATLGGGGFSPDDEPPIPSGGMGGGGGGGGGGGSPIPTNGLWLSITNVADSTVFANLNNGTDYVYEIFSLTNLSAATAVSNWNIETEVFPGINTDIMPFTVPMNGRDPLFLWARDWTGITSNGNTVPEWWLWFYFQTVDLLDSDLDASGQNTLLYDYTNGIDPAVIHSDDTPPLYIISPHAYWNVTDISDPAQPVNIGELQEPYSEPGYDITETGIPPFNTPWHTNTSLTFTEAYGTTANGGSNGMGTVFKIDPAGPLQGNQPNELVQCGSVLYGTTWGNNGTFFNGYGTIFSMNTNGIGFTNLYIFDAVANPQNGWQPEAGLVLSGSTLYGTTFDGGQYNCGTVFSFNITNNTFTHLYDFGGEANNDGASPCAKLILHGNTLYGTTSAGGVEHNEGTVFEINLATPNQDQILHSFTGGDGGADPQASLLLSGGVLYGTTESGGTNSEGTGTVFSFNPNNNTFTVFHYFGRSDSTNGGLPLGGLVISGSTLYGTTSIGGIYGDGAVFSINTGGTGYSVLHSFNGDTNNDGAVPFASLTLSGDTLCGTTEEGGDMNDGVIFNINISGSDYTNLYSFQDGPDGESPETALLLSSNTLYGTTLGDSALVGDPNYGTIFSINTDGSDFTSLSTFSAFSVLHEFTATNGDGVNPCSQLALSGSAFYGIPATVYGTTLSGGAYGYGTIFKINTDGTAFTNLYEFAGTNDGKYPATGLLIYGNALYGTTTNSIFKINIDGSDFTCLTNITNASQLILSLSGNMLYGTTSSGGTDNLGMVFSINTNGTGFTDLYSFTGGTNGASPRSGLEVYGIGNSLASGTTNLTLFGTTSHGGVFGYGMVFSITNNGTGFTDLHDFDETNGANPVGGLLITNNNTVVQRGTATTYLYGTTFAGGTNGDGTLFGMNLDGSGFTNLYNFGGANGAGTQPDGKLAELNGTVYGTTSGGGAYTNGMVFSLDASGNFTDLYDFSGGGDGGSPLAGLTLSVADNESSIWALDTTINVSAENLTNLNYSIAIDNFDVLYVNGIEVSWTNNGQAAWSPYSPLTPYLHQGENAVRVIIGGDRDGVDYFAMTVRSAAPGVVFTNLFGTTSSGGSNGDGTVFEITPGGYETNLYSFSGLTDGANPVGNLVLSGNTLYGVTKNGGLADGSGVGTIFSITTNGAFQTLYTFTNLPGGGNFDGANPAAGLILSGSTLYGTTENGGSNSDGTTGDGTIFRINTDGSGYTNLYSFAGAGANDGASPQALLVSVSNTLYGTTYSGGSGKGTIFSINTDGSGYTNLYSFAGGSDGANPMTDLLLAGNILYGTTSAGGNNDDGTIFSFTLGSTNDVIFHSFFNSPDGASPAAGLALSGNTLYGTTEYGGAYGDGTLFSVGINNHIYANLRSFGAIDSSYGQNPQANLIILDGSLYGIASQGGAYGDNGMVFSISTNGANFNDLYDFMGNPDGARPEGGLCSP